MSCCVVLIASVESLNVAFRNAVLYEGSQLVALAVASCVVLSRAALSRAMLSRRVSCRVLSCHVVSCRVMSSRFLSFPLLLIFSYHDTFAVAFTHGLMAGTKEPSLPL